MYAYCTYIMCTTFDSHLCTHILKLWYTELIVHLFPYNSENMIFLVGEKEKKKIGVGFLSKCRRGGFVAGEGLSWGAFVAGVRLSLG